MWCDQNIFSRFPTQSGEYIINTKLKKLKTLKNTKI